MRPVVALLGLFAVFAFSCGESEGAEPLGPVAIVFAADHLDVYGPLDITIEGGERLTLESGDSSCERPSLYVEESEFTFEATSQFGLYWAEAVQLSPSETCRVVPLRLQNISTGFAFYSEVFRSECFPMEAFFSLDGAPEVPIGRLDLPWKFDYSIFPKEPTRDELLEYLVGAVRQGKAFLFGGGENPEARFELRIESLNCDNGGTFSGGFNYPGYFEIFSTEAG